MGLRFSACFGLGMHLPLFEYDSESKGDSPLSDSLSSSVSSAPDSEKMQKSSSVQENQTAFVGGLGDLW